MCLPRRPLTVHTSNICHYVASICSGLWSGKSKSQEILEDALSSSSAGTTSDGRDLRADREPLIQCALTKGDLRNPPKPSAWITQGVSRKIYPLRLRPIEDSMMPLGVIQDWCGYHSLIQHCTK